MQVPLKFQSGRASCFVNKCNANTPKVQHLGELEAQTAYKDNFGFAPLEECLILYATVL